MHPTRPAALALLALAPALAAPARGATQGIDPTSRPAAGADEPAAATPVRDAIGPAPVLVVVDPAAPVVDGLLVLDAGSLRDPADRVGLAALAAAGLRTGGSDDVTAAELDAWLADRAAELAIEATDDHLRVTFRCEPGDVAPLLDRLGSLLTAPAFDPAAIEAARATMLAALASEADDGAALADRAIDRLLYGGRSPHGRAASATSVAAITRADLVAWAGTHLGIDRLHLGLSGDLDPEAAVTAARAALGELPPVGAPAPVPSPDFWTPERSRIFVVDRPGATRTELRLAAPGVRLDDPDHPLLALWSYAVGTGGPDSRMATRLHTEQGLADAVGCRFEADPARPGQLLGFCATPNDAVGEALSEMLDLVMQTGDEPIPADELAAARARLLADRDALDARPAEALARAMTLEAHDYPLDFWSRDLARLAAADGAAIQAAVRRHIPPARFLVVAVGPAEEIVPELETVAEVELLGEEQPLADAGPTVARMLDALGGAGAWARLETVHLELTVEVTYPNGQVARIPVEQHRSFEPLRIRMKQVTPAGATYTNVVGPEGGRVKLPTGLSDLPAAQVRAWQDQLSRWLYYNLHRLAKADGSLAAGLDEQGRLVLLGSGGELGWIELGEDDRPARMGLRQAGAEKVYTYGQWTEVEGVWYAARFVEDGNQVATISVFEPFVELPDSTWQL